MSVQLHWSCTRTLKVNLQILGFATLIFLLQCFSNQQINSCAPLSPAITSLYCPPHGLHIRTFYSTIHAFFPSREQVHKECNDYASWKMCYETVHLPLYKHCSYTQSRVSEHNFFLKYVKADQKQTYIRNKILYLRFHTINSPYLPSFSLKNAGFNCIYIREQILQCQLILMCL